MAKVPFNAANLTPANLTPASQKVYQHFEVIFGSQRAAELVREFESIRGQFRKGKEELFIFEKQLQSVGNANSMVAKTLGSAATAVNSFTSFLNVGNLTAKSALDISLKYNDSFVKTYSQFSKYGMSVNQYKDRIESLRKTYNLTYEQSMRLTSSLEKGFNYTGPQKMDGFLQGLRNTVGNNIEAMTELGDAILAVADKNPLLEDMLANKNFDAAREYASAMVSTGELSLRQYKQFLELSGGQKRSTDQQSQLDSIQNPNNTIRALGTSIETGLKKTGDLQLSVIQGAVDWAGGMDKVSSILSSVVDKYVTIQTIAGLLTGSVSNLVGGATGALKALDMAANLRGMTAGGGLLMRGAGGLGAVGLGATAAYIGYKTGGSLADAFGLNGYDTSASGSFEEKANKSISSSSSEKSKLQSRLLALRAKSDTEKMQSLSGFSGLFRSQGVASNETEIEIRKAYEQLQKISQEEEKIESTQKSINQQSQGVLDKERDLTTRLSRNADLRALQQRILQSSNQLLSGQSNLYGKSGNLGMIGSSVARDNAEIDTQEKLAKSRLKDLYIQKEAAQNEDAKKRAIQEIYAVENELNDLNEKRVNNSNTVVNANQAQIEQQERIIGLSEANMNLLDSAGLGLKAQVGVRKEIIDQISVELGMLKAKEEAAIAEKSRLQEELKKATGDDYERIQRQIYEQDKNILDVRTQQTNQTMKQATLSKAMREGWISAIQSMTTGAGAFTRITIDQNNRLGNLAFARPDKLKALALGGTTGGRMESAQWTPGGFREGAAGANEKEILKQYNIDTQNTIQQTVEAVMERQKNVGSKMSPVAAAFGVGPQGAAEFTELTKNLTDILTVVFTKVGTAASNNALENMKKGK